MKDQCRVIKFVIKNKTLKKEYEESDFLVASKLYEHKCKCHTRGKWVFLVKIL